MRKALGGWKLPQNNPWVSYLHKNSEKNKATVEAMVNDRAQPLNYYAAYGPVKRQCALPLSLFVPF